MSPLQAACEELKKKSLRQIQIDTAYAWTYRAMAARLLSRQAAEAGDQKLAVQWLMDSQEYEHEGLEHAALAGDEVIAVVRRMMEAA